MPSQQAQRDTTQGQGEVFELDAVETQWEEPATCDYITRDSPQADTRC
jgi:hypothetical protein